MTETPPPPQSRLSLYGVADALQTFGLALLSPLALPGLMRDAEGAPGLPRWSRLTPRERWALVALPMVVTLILILGGLLITARLVAVVFFPGDLGAEALWAETRTSLFVIAAALGVPLVLWRAALATRQTMVQQDSHFTGQYAKAVEMLGADKDARTQGDGERRREPNIEVRLGAIYALERISKQSDADYLPIMDVLCAYVRQNAEVLGEPPDDLPEPPDEETAEERAARLAATRARVSEVRAWAERLRAAAKAPGRASAERPDLSAALDVLARRALARRKLEFDEMDEQSPDPPMVRLPERDVSCTEEESTRRRAAIRNHARIRSFKPSALDLWAHSGWAPVLTSAALQGADRPGSPSSPRFDLRRADARGIRLEGADLRGARLEGADLSNARLDGAELVGANLTGTVLREARIDGANLSYADLTGAFIDGASMQGSMLSNARLLGARLTSSRMEGANLSSAKMEGAILGNLRMDDSIFRSSEIFGSLFFKCSLYSADFRSSCLNGADFKSSLNMRNIDFSSSVLIHSQFGILPLENCNFSYCNLHHSSIMSNKITGSVFSRAMLCSAKLHNAHDIKLEQLSAGFGDALTSLPQSIGKLKGYEVRRLLVDEYGWSKNALSRKDALAAYRDWLDAHGHPHPHWLKQYLAPS